MRGQGSLSYSTPGSCPESMDGYYHPEYVVTRDQMAAYVARAFDLPD